MVISNLHYALVYIYINYTKKNNFSIFYYVCKLQVCLITNFSCDVLMDIG